MAFSCTTCSNSFDLDSHLPYVIPCGHSICKMCKYMSVKDCEISCSECNCKLGNSDFPLNQAIKAELERLGYKGDQSIVKCDAGEPNQILQVNNKQDTIARATFWNCCECEFALHPRQARLCIKCCPKDLVDNDGTSISINDYEKCESRLICAHCVMEGEHKFHITKVYLPIKMSQKAEDRCNRLMERIKKIRISREEASDLHQVLCEMRIKSADSVSWQAFEQIWNEADELISSIESATRTLTVKTLAVEETLKEIELIQRSKTELVEQMKRNVFAKSSEHVMRRSTLSQPSDGNEENLDNSSLRRFGGLYNLSVV